MITILSVPAPWVPIPSMILLTCWEKMYFEYLTDHYSEAPQMFLFDYERTRAGYHPVNFLGDTFHGDRKSVV